MNWWNIKEPDKKILKELKHYGGVIYDTVDRVLEEIEDWLGKGSENHVIITHEIPVIKKAEQKKSQQQANINKAVATQHTNNLSHKSGHCPQILKTADPFIEGGLINTGLLIEDLMHNLPDHVPRNEHTKRALLSIIIKHLQNRHTNPTKGRHNWVSFAKGLGDGDLHNKELEEQIVASIMKMYGSEEHLLHQNRPVITPEEAAVKDRKYWQEQVIAHVLHGLDEADRIETRSL